VSTKRTEDDAGVEGDYHGGEAVPDQGNGRLVDRRDYLKLASAAAATAGMASLTSASTGTTRHGIEFDRVLDAVDDLGLDPTGNEPVNSRLDSALEEGTLVRFPEGEYQFDGTVVFDADRVGVLGEGDVRFIPPQGFTGLLFNYDPVPDDVLIENVDIDMRADDTTTGIRLKCRNQFHIEDIEFLGRGLIDNSGQVSAFLLGLTSESGRGVLRNAVAKKGSRVDGYARGNGRIGVWVGWSNKGTVRIEGCDFREFGNNGTYTSRTPGQVEIVDSYFLNNNASNVRIGGEGSFIENCTIEIDFEKYTGPPLGDLSTGFGMRGIQVESGVQLEGAESIPAGAEVRNCELIGRNAPNGIAMVNLSPQGRSLLVEDTRIQVDIDNMWAARRGRPGTISWREWQQTAPKPHSLQLNNVSITGSASGREAVHIDEADSSTVRNCCIHQSGSNRDGVNFVDSSGGAVEDSTIDVTGTAITMENSTCDTASITQEGSCPLPNPDRTASTSSDSTTSETTSTPSETHDGQELVIDGGHTTDRLAYTFSVDGSVEPGDRANANDVIDGTTVTGQVEGGIDSFWVTGEFTELQVEGDITVRLDGETVDPANLVSSSTETATPTETETATPTETETATPTETETATPTETETATPTETETAAQTHDTYDSAELVIDGSGTYDRVNYTFTVDGSVEPGDRANANDVIDGTTVTGQVEGGIDSFWVTGEFTELEIDADIPVRLDGEMVDPANLVVTTRTVEIDGSHTAERLEYTFSVDGSVEAGDRANVADTIEGSSVAGQTEGGVDSYLVTGEFTNFQTDGDPVVRVDGEAVDPETLDGEHDLPHELVVVGAGAEANYLVETTGSVAKRGGMWGAEAADSASGAVARGTVTDGRDTFGFSGSITQMEIEGNASLTFER